MQFGVFEHMDRGPVPLGTFYESRLRLAEDYDRLGFAAYHVAEHHATPLGHAPSPALFFAALAQRTRRLRFGPLVYLLPLYHPLRLIDEICMLDQMSGGRFELGVGRGISPIELSLFGLDAAQSPSMFAEALQIVLAGLQQDSLTFTGNHYSFRDVPIELAPQQRPHPPLWYGIGRADAVPWAVRHRMNIVSNLPAPAARPIVDAFRSEWDTHGTGPLSHIGLVRHVVVAETDAEAERIAAHGYPRWRDSFLHLWLKHGTMLPSPAALPSASFAEAENSGRAIAGTPDKVASFIRRTVADGGVNYLLCRFAFGDIAEDEARESARLFARHVMPEFASS
jgi:alkanesulfonate monooxygenase SsuD/methylene tetrahydromethanopterin reductase-like flavin-dependent oxidoreductase (luciferase family)